MEGRTEKQIGGVGLVIPRFPFAQHEEKLDHKAMKNLGGCKIVMTDCSQTRRFVGHRTALEMECKLGPNATRLEGHHMLHA